MSNALRSIACLMTLLFVAVAHGARQDGDVSDVAELRRARQRWELLTPEQQQEVRANYRRYLALGEEERAELRRRAEATREAVERLHESLPQDVRARLAALDPAKRREVLHDMHEAEASETGRRIRSKMPEDWLTRLERAEPGQRGVLLRRFQEQQRGRVARGAVEAFGKSLELPEAEIRRRQNLPDDERAELVLAMRGEVQARNADETGLPPGLTWEQWESWSRLPPREFFTRIMDFRERSLRDLEDAAPGEGAGAARPGGEQGGAEQPRVARTSGADQPLPRVLRRLSTALRPDPRDALELIELTSPERQRAMSARRRARCMQLMLGERLLPQARMLELESLPDEAFFDFVRQMLRHSGYLGTEPAVDDGAPGAQPDPPQRAAAPTGARDGRR